MCKVDSFVITNAPSLRYTAPLQVLRPQDAGELGGLIPTKSLGLIPYPIYNQIGEVQWFHLFLHKSH